ncbi:Rho GTPase-activating protein 1 [Striga hermonthica]|uniref:Rho GTPase-activating protein 1 n=1 Tax=Striga hermonthica TaxID=68872 RepID=A0A9N7NUL6_STRHE|nr:Rho GTPase-activating protein 1 [Striga hermonthica]
MTGIIQLPSPSSSTVVAPKDNDAFRQQTCFLNRGSFVKYSSLDLYGGSNYPTARKARQSEEAESSEEEEEEEGSVLAVVVAVLRKYSPAGCNRKCDESCGVEEELMEIGVPTEVRHVAHVTFDRFDGFLGLPVEFEPEVPRRPPSASTRVFGVSTESMQLSFDSRGNCVPTILLMMQRRLYEQGGLQYEGIFRINPANGQEEHVREQLNNGVIPHNIDVHCLAGLIKAWFRELPNGILDSLPPDQVMGAQTEEECVRLVKLLPQTKGALLDWAVNLMADVAQLEQFNKMNARNVAMVFAPNMTQMADPLTALMFAVQVMNFLKTLIERALREREDSLFEAGPVGPTDGRDGENYEEGEIDKPEEPAASSPTHELLSSIENLDAENAPAVVGSIKARPSIRRRGSIGKDARKKGLRKYGAQRAAGKGEERDKETENKEKSVLRRVSSRTDRVETWR